MLFKIIQGYRQCKFMLPVMSAGGVCIGERQCLLPRGHDGPHKDGHGGVIVNQEALHRDYDKRFG